jgi:hypothetical protein
MSGFAKKGSTAAGSLVAAPKTLRYEHDGGLPVAIEAKSNRRAYVPNNGSNLVQVKRFASTSILQVSLISLTLTFSSNSSTRRMVSPIAPSG